MRRLVKFILVLCCLFGCAAAEDAETLIVETGTAEQATTYRIHNQFGRKLSTGERCIHSPSNFGGTICGMPENTTMTWSLNYAPNTTLAEALGARSGFLDLTHQVRTIGGYTQWTFEKQPDNSERGAILIKLGCFDIPSNLFGRADSGTFIGTGIKHYGQTHVLIDLCHTRARRDQGHPSSMTPWTTSQYMTFVYNVTKHEAGHALGLGHNPSANQCFLMANPINPECWLSALSLEADELTILGTFMVL